MLDKLSFQPFEMAPVTQKLFSGEIPHVGNAVRATLGELVFFETARPGQTVAVCVGSRGIDRIDRVVFHCLESLREKGLKPFVVPAMGSHGGATAQGQKKVLAGFGITEKTMGAPIAADMDVVRLDSLPSGPDIYLSRQALEADWVIPVNRVKPHTKFMAEIESGLCKMLTIGLGKVRGAAEYHRCAVRRSFRIIEEAAAMILSRLGKIPFGIALLEDGYGKLCHVEALASETLIDREKGLLREAYSRLPRIPFDNLDLLIVDTIGKSISGIGMDSNVTGRHRDIVGDFNTHPHVKRIFVRDLAPGSDGNAIGIGLADITTRRLVEAMNPEKTYVNALAAISPEKAAIPIHFDTDRKALSACAMALGLESLEGARTVRIKNTKSLDMLLVSKALEEEVASNPDLSRIGHWELMTFDGGDNLFPISDLPKH